MATAKDKAIQDKANQGIMEGITTSGAKPEKSAAPLVVQGTTPPSFDVSKFAGIFAVIGLAIGAIGTVVASIVTGFMRLVWWQMPLTLLGLLLLISWPSLMIAWLKLRQRILAPTLDANSWAINCVPELIYFLEAL